MSPDTLILHADSPEEFYGLEAIHDFLGWEPEAPILCGFGDLLDKPEYRDRIRIAFPRMRREETFPVEAEWSVEGKLLSVHTDVVGWTVRCLGRYEEADTARDAQGRVPLRETFAFRQGLSETPFLDDLLASLRGPLESFLAAHGAGFRLCAPLEKPTVCLTHDADSIRAKSPLRYLTWMARGMARGPRGLVSAWKRAAAQAARPGNPHFSFREYRDLEGSHGYKSTFFLMSLPFVLGAEGRRYTLGDRELKGAVEELATQGWEFGLHPSRKTHLAPARLASEQGRLGAFLGRAGAGLGVRNHYLKAEFPGTWELQEKLGFAYDSSLGWSEGPGFRCGTSRAYRPFHRDAARRMEVWELPMVAMDTALRLPETEMVEKLRGLAARCASVGSPFTLLWHTDRLNGNEYPEHERAYRRALEAFRGEGYQGMTAAETVGRFRDHGRAMEAARRRAPGGVHGG